MATTEAIFNVVKLYHLTYYMSTCSCCCCML